MINRAAMTVRPLQPCLDWVRGVCDLGTTPLTDQEATVYLIPEDALDMDEETALASLYADVFELELEAWYTDESAWPSPRTLAMFREWFKVEFHTLVMDLGDGQIVEDSLD